MRRGGEGGGEVIRLDLQGHRRRLQGLPLEVGSQVDVVVGVGEGRLRDHREVHLIQILGQGRGRDLDLPHQMVFQDEKEGQHLHLVEEVNLGQEA